MPSRKERNGTPAGDCVTTWPCKTWRSGNYDDTEVITEQPAAVADYYAGKMQALNFLVGQL